MLKRIVQIEIVVIAIIAFYFLKQSGQDLLEFYVPMAKGCFNCALNPWYAAWIFFPMRLLPFPILRALWAGFTTGALIWCANRLKTQWWVVLLAFPFIGQVWLGQVDALVALGLVIALTAKNPYVRGLGLLLASVKPQISAAAMLVIAWYELVHDAGYRRNWPVMVIPGAVLALSFVVFGIDWPLRWLSGRRTVESLPEWGMAAFWPYGAISFVAVFFVKGEREKIVAALLASALTLPWFGVYSYVVFLVFLAPWWVIPLSYMWLLALPIMGSEALRFAFVLPLGLLGWMLYPRVREWFASRGRIAYEETAKDIQR